MGPGGDTPQNPTPYKNKTNLPSYIDKAQFARALLDVTGLSAATPAEAAQASGPQAIAALNAQVAAIADPQISAVASGYRQPHLRRREADRKRGRRLVRQRNGPAERDIQAAHPALHLPCGPANCVHLQHGRHPGRYAALGASFASRRAQDPDGAPSDVLQGKAPATEEQEMAVIDSLAQADLPVGWAPGHFLEVSDSQGHWVSIWSPTIVFSSLLGWVITAAAALFGARSGSTRSNRSFA